MLGLLSTIIRERERSDQEKAYDGKIALAHEHNWAPITSTSAPEVARTSARRLGHPVRASFFLDFFGLPPTPQRVGESISGFFWRYWLNAQLSPKRGALVQKNSLASCQRCRHSVEPRTLTNPFRHSDLIAWSLLIGHPTHKYFWGRLCFVQDITFYYKDIKQEIVHTLLLEEYGVSKMWVIVMDRRQDLNMPSTPAGKSGPSAQERYCGRGLRGGAKKRRANER